MNKRVLLFLLKLLFSYKRNKAKVIDAIGKIRVSLFPMWVLYQPFPYKVTGQDIQSIQNRIQPGDIILTGCSWKKL